MIPPSYKNVRRLSLANNKVSILDLFRGCWLFLDAIGFRRRAFGREETDVSMQLGEQHAYITEQVDLLDDPAVNSSSDLCC